jgi:hypothetical protein
LRSDSPHRDYRGPRPCLAPSRSAGAWPHRGALDPRRRAGLTSIGSTNDCKTGQGFTTLGGGRFGLATLAPAAESGGHTDVRRRRDDGRRDERPDDRARPALAGVVGVISLTEARMKENQLAGSISAGLRPRPRRVQPLEPTSTGCEAVDKRGDRRIDIRDCRTSNDCACMRRRSGRVCP